MKYLLLIRDIENANINYTKMSEWLNSEIYYGYSDLDFSSIRYFENETIQVVMLLIKSGQEYNIAEVIERYERDFQYYIIFDNEEIIHINDWHNSVNHILGTNFERIEPNKPIRDQR